MATRKTKRYNEGGMAPEMGGPRAPDQEAPVGPSNEDGLANLAKMMGRVPTQAAPQNQDGPANLAAMMGRTKEMRMPAMPPQDTGPTLGSASGREPGPQDTPPERIIGERMPDDVGRDRPMPMVDRPMPMVDAVKNIMGRRGRNPGRARAMGASMGGFSAGGSVSSASKRGDGIAQKGKTRGKMC